MISKSSTPDSLQNVSRLMTGDRMLFVDVFNMALYTASYQLAALVHAASDAP